LCGSLESSTLIRHAEIAVFVVGHSQFGIQSEFGWERLLGTTCTALGYTNGCSLTPMRATADSEEVHPCESV
jgi:hypothetical protein